MKHNIQNVNRKDEIPENTITRIKGILDKYNIPVKEVLWKSYNECWYSVRLEVEGFQCIGVNGKGITKSYALASAYGELMERLESRSLIKPTFGIFNYYDKVYIDEIELLPNEFIEECNLIGRMNDFVERNEDKNLENLIINNKTMRRMIPFYSFNLRRLVNLPYKLINMCCGSNGLCAGNTKEEAIIQGICEIFERYVHRNIFNGKLELFEIPIETIKELHSYSLILEIQKKGYQVVIKDCSMQGLFPVVGVLIMNARKDRYKFVLGCDPNLDIALQRCVTEIFQGISFDESFENTMTKIDWNTLNDYETVKEDEWLKCVISNHGHHPVDIFQKNSFSIRIGDYLRQNDKSNKQYLKDIVNELKEHGYDILIRNYSYLGFPCYRVYIPSMTETRKLKKAELKYLEIEYQMKRAYCDLKSCTVGELKTLISVLSSLRSEPKYRYYGYTKSLAQLYIDYFEENEKMNYDLIGFLICLQCGNKKEALQYLNHMISDHESEYVNEEYIQAMRFFLLNDDTHTDNYANNYLVNKNILESIMEDYKNKQTIKRYALPSCPNCEKCNINQCYHSNWKKINQKLIEIEKIGISQEYDQYES